MGEAVKERCAHFGIAKHYSPIAEAEIGGHDDAGAPVKLTQQMEEQYAARGAERQVARLIQNHEIGAGQTLGDLPGLAPGLFLLQRVGQLDGQEETNLSVVMRDGPDAEGCRDVRFAGARATVSR